MPDVALPSTSLNVEQSKINDANCTKSMMLQIVEKVEFTVKIRSWMPNYCRRLPLKKSTNGQRCFSFRGAKLWNGLSAGSKQATSLYTLKKSI